MSAFGSNTFSAPVISYDQNVYNPNFKSGEVLMQQAQGLIFQKLHNLNLAVSAAKNPEAVLEDYSQALQKLITVSGTNTTGSNTANYLFTDKGGLLGDIKANFPFLTEPQQGAMHRAVGMNILNTMESFYLQSNPAASKILRDIGVDLGVPTGPGPLRSIKKSYKKKRAPRRRR